MRRLLMCALLGSAVGCGDSPPSGSQKPSDPNIKARSSYGGSLGPVGGGRSREYEGPASHAPDWAKPGSTPATRK